MVFATLPQQLAKAKADAPPKIQAWLAKKPDSSYTKLHGHPAKRDSVSSTTVEGMNGADSSANNGTAVRSHKPGMCLQQLVLHTVRRYDARAAKAQACSASLKITPGMNTFLKERKEGAQAKMPLRVVKFVNATRTKATITHGTPAVVRSVDVGAHPKCECGLFAVEKIPCGCMLIVCDEGGHDPAGLLRPRDSVAFWKAQYADLPATFAPGSEFLGTADSSLLAAPAAPNPPGRPSGRRIQNAMDLVKKVISRT